MKTFLADKWFSKYIRLRDADENGCAKCCTCGAYKDIKSMDCGHFVKRQHMATRFDECNCATQCKRCNAFEQGRDVQFGEYISKQWGVGALIQLALASHSTKKYTAFELKQIAEHYKQKALELSREKGIEIW